ncbi:class I SAM-dependent methyltransferase [Algihabitans albus]|uniref:class I SAM-dependent methyltransferase n=1 Tax=Algihabitans albus TaxID=2164067 RepID=UPI000E5CEE49|nr:class I SAM-dependent methyltransferase [Algihabitans albus]
MALPGDLEAFHPHLERLRIEPVAVEGTLRQADERFTACVEGTRRQFEMHDYRTMYRVPMLYDTMLYGWLRCQTPRLLAQHFKRLLATASDAGQEVAMLEVGAGSGAFASALHHELPAIRILGLDIIEEAKLAAARDRPGAYDGYLVADLCNMSEEAEAQVAAFAPNCVGVASATGWGNHIPVAGFEQAFAYLQPRGWFIFHVKPNDPDPECVALVEWIEAKLRNGEIVDSESDRIFHRYGVTGEEIYYEYVIGRKAA